MDETQNDAPFVAFYDMHAVTFVPPDEMADVTIAGLQWFILIPPIKPHGLARNVASREPTRYFFNLTYWPSLRPQVTKFKYVQDLINTNILTNFQVN